MNIIRQHVIGCKPGPDTKRAVKALAEKYGVTPEHIYRVTKDIRPQRKRRSDAWSAARRLRQLAKDHYRTEGSIELVIAELRELVGNPTLKENERIRAADLVRKFSQDLTQLQEKRRMVEVRRDEAAEAARQAEEEDLQVTDQPDGKPFPEYDGDIEGLAHLLDRRVDQVHRKMIEHQEQHPEESLTIGARGIGKSEILVAVKGIDAYLRNQDIRICIASGTEDQAEANLGEIRDHLESETFIEKYGDRQGDKWSEEELKCLGRTRVQKEATFTAVGLDAKRMISRHYDMIICDDLVNLENSATPRLREKLARKFWQKLRPMLMPGGSLHIIGTLFYPDDLHDTFRKDGFADCTLQIPVLKGNGHSVWPEGFPLTEIKKIREKMPPIHFLCQYMLDVEAMKGTIFNHEWIEFYNPDDLPERLRVYQGVDLAISEKSKADYFAIVTIGVDRLGNIYVLDVYRSRLSFGQQMTKVKEKAKDWKPVRIAIEAVAYQAALPRELVRMTSLPIREVHTHKDKTTRAMALSGKFENGKVFLGKKQRELHDQLIMFPEAKHDDLFDALEMAISVSDSMEPRIRVLVATEDDDALDEEVA